MDIKQKLGRFRIELGIIEECPEACLAIMAQVIVVGCSFDSDCGAFEYLAMSEHFKPYENREAVPFYYARFQIDGTKGSRRATFKEFIPK